MTPAADEAQRDTSLSLPAGYSQLLDELKQAVRAARLRAHHSANAELLRLYWRLGSAVADRQQEQGWGGKVIERLAADLRAEFPEMRACRAATSSTCGSSRAPGRAPQSSNSLLDDCRGATSRCCWTSSTIRRSGTGMRQRRSSMAGPAVDSFTKSLGACASAVGPRRPIRGAIACRRV